MPTSDHLFMQQERERRRKQKEKEAREKAEAKRRDNYFISREIIKKQQAEFREAVKDGIEFGEQAGDFAGNLFMDAMDAKEDFDNALFEKNFGELDGEEMLEELDELEEFDSPFRKLHEKIKGKDGPSAETKEAVREFIQDGRRAILIAVKTELAREKQEEKSGSDDSSREEEKRRFDNRLHLRMNVMRKCMPAHEFNALCREVSDLGIAVKPEDFRGITYAEMRRRKLQRGLTRLKEMKSGQTPGYFKMMNSMDRYLKNGAPDRQSQEDLAKNIGEFILKDCAPGKRGVDQKAFQTAMYSMKCLLPEKGFNQFLNQVNGQPGRGVHYKAEDFNKPAEQDAPERKRELEDPVLRIRNPWEQE